MSSREDSPGDLRKSLYEAGLNAALAELRDRRPPRDDREFSLTEILEEMTLLLADTSRHIAAGTPGDGLWRAGDDAIARDRAKESRGPRHLADLLAYWLLARADRATDEESVRAAVAAAQGSPRERALPVVAEPPAALDPDDGDLLLFESGTEEIDETRRPYVAFTRQFALRDPVEDEGIEQLRCTFWLEQAAAPPTEIVWSGPYLPLSKWVRAVEATQGFSMLATARAVASEIQQDPV